jgi:UDP-2-acetamido-3-amino-2,3-dideoxy-glucuronate N-acetyltransferase
MQSFSVHPSAVIDPGATIGLGTRIWHFSHICAGAKIGDHVVIGQNVYVANRVVIGHGVKIQNNVSVYDDVILEDDVFCGPSMVFTNVINPRAAISRKNEYRQTHVKKGATLGANCTIICGHTIGEYALVGAGSVVTSDVPAHALMMGVPARHVGWVSRAGLRLALPLTGDGTAACPQTSKQYRLVDNQCQPC